MDILNSSRKRQKEGDIFAYKMSQESFFRFGRVIRLDAKIGVSVSVLLLYFYKAISPDKYIIPELNPADLLISPVGTNRQGWLRGYYETVERRPIAPGEKLPVHHFRDVVFKKYRDEDGEVVQTPIEPIGDYVLHSFRTIDYRISDALGIPRSEEQ